MVVSSTFGDTLRFSLCDGSFIRESLKTPVGKVVKLLIGRVILWVQARRVSAVDDVPLGAFGHVVCPGSHRRDKNMRALRPDSCTELVELTYQPEEQRIRLPYGGVGKVLEDREQSEVMGSSQVPQCYSVSVCPWYSRRRVAASRASFPVKVEFCLRIPFSNRARVLAIAGWVYSR